MGDILTGLDRERVAALRAEGRFFWADVTVGPGTRDELAEVLAVPEHALRKLLDFHSGMPSPRKFHADGEHVVFAFSCFVDSQPVEVHLLVSGDYVLTVHQQSLSLPDLLEVEPPQGRSEQYLIYAVLEGMLATAFDALNDVDSQIESLQTLAMDLRTAQIRNEGLREITAQLTQLRRTVAPQRGTFARIAEEIGQVEGLEHDSEHYFDRIGDQVNRLVDAIDAAGNAVARVIDLRVNETIYWLTLVATVFLPLTFITGFFGMNFGWMVRHISSPVSFIVLGVGGCVLGVLLTLVLVRRRATPIDRR
jgi:magnesium transporter